ncbi:MAG: DUF1080 domain-containing protein [Cyclobacteriaceae bacterium]
MAVSFDGKTLNGWKFFKDRENNTWEVKDGAIHCKPTSDNANKRADLMTANEFENFELKFDFKVSPKGNSGVIYRASEEFDQPYLSGPEFQVLDDVGYPEKQDPVRMTGANYDMHGAPATKKMKPAGQWNSAKIVAKGNHIEHWLNGKKVLEYDINSDDWKKRKENSKWKKADGYGQAKKGHIDLQDHDCEVWYKNIKIKSL